MVAVLGTGIMGAAMARSMLRAGLDVKVWNRSSERAAPLADLGITVCSTAREAVAGEDVVVTLLYDADSVIDVMSSVGDAGRGAVWLQMSTVGIEGTERITALAERTGLALLDAPVVGTRGPAEQGTLVVLVSGDSSLEDRVRAVLDTVGSRTVWVSGEPGAATALKLVVNSWVASLNAAAGQSVAMARGLGLDPQLFLDTVAGGPTDAPYLQLKGSMMIAGDYPTAFALDNARKDIDLMNAAATTAGVHPALLETLRSIYRIASERGHGEQDMAAVVEGFTADVETRH